MVRPSVSDPPGVETLLWSGYDGASLGFDVGANCGQSIPHMLQACAHVVAFEPNREAFAEMERQWGHNTSVVLRNTAVSSSVGTVTLAQLPGEQKETGQLVTPGTRGMEWDPGDWSVVPVEEFPCRDLDSLQRDHGVPDFIKVDTEGHEGHVLLGARRLIAQHRPDWLIEFHSPEGRSTCLGILETLGSGGYKIETVRHPHYPENSHMWHQHGWIRALSR